MDGKTRFEPLVQIALPAGAPAGVSLYFDPQELRSEEVSVYLCNAEDDDLLQVAVRSQGITIDGDGELATGMAERHFERLPAKTCVRLEVYDRRADGDFVTIYELAFRRPDGVAASMRTTIGRGGPTRAWKELRGG